MRNNPSLSVLVCRLEVCSRATGNVLLKAMLMKHGFKREKAGGRCSLEGSSIMVILSAETFDVARESVSSNGVGKSGEQT